MLLAFRRKYLWHWYLEALLCGLQGSQQVRCLAVGWQHWVDGQGAEQLARTLVSRCCPSPHLPSPFSPHTQPSSLETVSQSMAL